MTISHMSGYIKTLIDRLKLTSPENRERLRRGFPIEFPSELANPLIDYMLERSYLEDISERDDFISERMQGTIGWIRIDRLPIHPDNMDYDLLSRWQSVLSSLHTWNDRLLFLLQRQKGSTHLYVGLQTMDSEDALPRLDTALANSMPGIQAEKLNPDEAISMINALVKAKSAGAITGLPSFRRELN